MLKLEVIWKQTGLKGFNFSFNLRQFQFIAKEVKLQSCSANKLHGVPASEGHDTNALCCQP